MSEKKYDVDKIKSLVDLMNNNDLVEIEIKQGEDKLLLKRAQPPQQTTITPMPIMNAAMPGAGAVQPEAAQPSQAGGGPEVDDGLVAITSPIVGTFYAQPSPDSDPFIEVGSRVSSQSIVCIVEAMKVMNEIKAETNGTVAQILVENGQAVEYGQVLFKVKPD